MINHAWSDHPPYRIASDCYLVLHRSEPTLHVELILKSKSHGNALLYTGTKSVGLDRLYVTLLLMIPLAANSQLLKVQLIEQLDGTFEVGSFEVDDECESGEVAAAPAKVGVFFFRQSTF